MFYQKEMNVTLHFEQDQIIADIGYVLLRYQRNYPSFYGVQTNRE
jgi:hypothetical protein